MPSNALGKFEGAMMKDVNRIIATHASIQNGGRGNKALGHLTRSGVLLLCAAWELYVEELMIEAVRECSQRAQSPSDLPKSVQKSIAEHVKGSQHQLRVLALAGDGWRAVYAEMAVEWVSSLNTPNKHNINEGFKKLIGIEGLASNWSFGDNSVNDFVKARGDVAHKGSAAGNIHMNKLRETYLPQIMRCAVDTDNAVSTYIRSIFEPKAYPWNRRGV